MIFLIRFLTGYVCFRISGSRPGAFVNDLIRHGINVWNITSSGGEIYAAVSREDYPLVQSLCRGTSRRVHITAKRGVPFFIYKHRSRAGLAVGFAGFLLLFKLLSLFIWNIDMCEFNTISETSAREILERVGFYEGVRGDFESLKRMQTSAMIEFGNLSWITINADGSRGEVNATEKYLPETNDTAPRNLKAKADGQVIRADVYSGAAAVNSGDAVVKGSLLVSGVVETELGGMHMEHADGTVIARTSHKETIVIPRSYRRAVYDAEPKSRFACRIFGVFIPLTFMQTDGDILTFRTETKAEFMGEAASVSLIEENLYNYSVEDCTIDRAAADKLMKKQMLLRELFHYSDADIINRDIVSDEKSDKYIYTVQYACEEDIAEPSPILISENFRIAENLQNDDEDQ